MEESWTSEYGCLLTINWIIIFLGIYEIKDILNREGYLRLASESFDLSALSLKNNFIHLTNNAV